MTCHELVIKLERGRNDLLTGFLTEEEYVQWIADLFDGNLAFALESAQSLTPAARAGE